MVIVQPLDTVDMQGKFDLKVMVAGGGESGQAGAIRHGLTRALIAFSPELKDVLKKASKLILPGVGHFAFGMKKLGDLNLIEMLHDKALVEKVLD